MRFWRPLDANGGSCRGCSTKLFLSRFSVAGLLLPQRELTLSPTYSSFQSTTTTTPSTSSTPRATTSTALTMPSTSNERYGPDLLLTYNARKQPTSARLRQAYVEDTEDESEARYDFTPQERPGVPSENPEWYGVELTPMLGESDT
jgi:hypothetical protein